MHTTAQLIELAKQRLASKHGLPLPMTDYRLAKLLNVSTQVVSGWQNGSRTIGAKFVRKFADACDLPPEYVYACTQAERADTADEVSLLERIAEAFKSKAAAWIVAAMVTAGMVFAPAGNQAHARVSDGPGYALCAHGRRRRKGLAERLARFFTIFPVAVLTGCAALQTPEERAWQAVHLVDSMQTYRIAQDGGRCYRETDPLTSQLIGETPSRESVIAWSIGTSLAHAAVTEALLRAEQPRAARIWNYITIGAVGEAVYHNWQIGIRIGAPNKCGALK